MLVTNPKFRTIQAAKMKINSIPAKTGRAFNHLFCSYVITDAVGLLHLVALHIPGSVVMSRIGSGFQMFIVARTVA